MVVVVKDPFFDDESSAFAEKWSLSLADQEPEDYYFYFDTNGLNVGHSGFGPNFKIHLDFNAEIEKLRSQRLGMRKDLLCRAVGYSGQEAYCVFDSCLGFAKDALHLMSFGCHVIGCEQNPLVFAMVEEALSRAPKWSSQLQVLQGLGQDHLASQLDKINCLYLDPMYEDTHKKSAPKKSMQLLRHLNSSDQVREWDWQVAQRVKRVVVKRAPNGENLFERPSSSVVGKTVRFDIYAR